MMLIDEKNIESVLFDYAENNLSNAERKEVEQYLNLHAEYRQILRSYDPDITIDKPLDIVYEDKDDLFKLATSGKQQNIILVSRYVKWISGIAAMFVLFFAVKSFYTVQNTQETAMINDFEKTEKTDDINTTTSGENKTSFGGRETSFYAHQTTFHAHETTFGGDKVIKGENQTIAEAEKTSENHISKDKNLLQNNFVEPENIALNESDRITKPQNEENSLQDIQSQQENYISNSSDNVLYATEDKPQRLKDKLLEKGVNSALQSDLGHSAISGIAKVITHPATKKVANILTGKRGKKTKVIYQTTTTSEQVNV